ncbi:DCC1-like thiol-disulfide oxidoreductase family protein [Azohydromonas sediminis]|uniref:DCC1-like thiol-disulfide oxidoreductase family protein n=1 Tax=Azohydromonas sediminis TaxID=2259674 RepID=UPI000E65639E|nr:DCC1-like thiol-disulfide oxidoreductase family protein [Azohydromonas sediminis]
MHALRNPSPPAPTPGAGAPALSVLYDGACPLCRRVIGLCRGLRATRPLCLADVGAAARLRRSSAASDAAR